MATSKPPGDKLGGAGLNLASPDPRVDEEETVPKPQASVASRAVALSSYFLSGALAINLSQFLGTPLYLINQDWYNAWIAFTKQSFGLLTMTLTQTFSPTRVFVSGDASVRGQLLRKSDGTLLLDFPERIVLIANHQIYTDWLYLWWTAYCSGMHGYLYIILKESLKKIPILGWGMQFNQFIFLKRDWEKDRGHMAQALGRLNKLTDPMWLLLFPEGTNLAPSTREKSAKWAAKTKTKDMRHCLLPRSTGLRFCLQELKDTVGYVYDCTIAYEGVPRGSYAQDIFTLKAGYLEGRPPKSVSMYWRRFALKNIPIENEKAFELWLLARWREKDLLIENYLIHGHFPADTGTSRTPQGQTKRGAGYLNVEIRSSHWYEFLQIFAPMGVLAMVLYVFYGALPQKFFKSKSGQALKDSASDLKTLASSAKAPSMPKPSAWNLDNIFDKDKQSQTFGNAGMALAQWVQSPEATRMMNSADLVQKWLQDPQKLLLESLTGPTDKQSFTQALKDEEEKRKVLSNKHHGTFWQDLDTAESRPASSVRGSVRGSGMTGVVGAGPGNFHSQLAKKQAANRNSTTGKPAVKGASFWNDLSKEQNKRTGTIFTLSDVSSDTATTAINSVAGTSTTLASSRVPPKLTKPKPKKLGPASTASSVKGASTPAKLPPKKTPTANTIQKTNAQAKATTPTNPAPWLPQTNGAKKAPANPAPWLPQSQGNAEKKPPSTTAQPKPAPASGSAPKIASKPAAAVQTVKKKPPKIAPSAGPPKLSSIK